MIAAIFIPDFPLQAWLRAYPDRTNEPLVVVRGTRRDGSASIRCVTHVAAELGLRAGMTVAQARALTPDLAVLLADETLEASARDALTDVASSFSPRVEIGRGQATGWAFVDVAGLDQLIGDARDVALALSNATRHVGLSASVGVGRTKTLARLAALGGDGCQVVPCDTAAERAFVADLALEALEPKAKLSAQLRRFGLMTVGELLALPIEEVAERLGPEGLALCRRARGEEEGGGLTPDEPPVRFCERVALDDAVENLEPLTFVLRGALDRLVQRLSLRGFLAGDLQITLDYEGHGRHVCVVRCGAPSRDVPSLVALCRLVLTKNPPTSAVQALMVQVTPEAPRSRQLSFFEAVGPAPDKLAVTVARLKALCGIERVGVPQPGDSYRDDTFDVTPFGGASIASTEHPAAPTLALRRFRPPKPVDVIWRNQVPVRIDGGELGGRVISWSGPYRRSEGWWVDGRDPQAVHGECDIYDLQLSNGVAYRVAYDRCCARWLAQGWYD